jgi:hypothetical protein
MDWDPELDVTLSNGRRVVSFQIAAIAGTYDEVWAVLEPGALRRVILGRAAALATRQRVDTRIAARLAAGWVPMDGHPAVAPRVPPTPLPPDLVVQISSLLEALGGSRSAIGAADPSGQLWAACHIFLRQVRRFGLGAPRARVERARRACRLAELAEQAGDLPAAVLHYRAALASHAGVGVTRRLAWLAPPGPAATAPGAAAGPAPTGPASGRGPGARARDRAGSLAPRVPARLPHISTGLVARTERSCVSGPPARPEPRRNSMNGRIQIVGRLPVALNRRVRAAAKRRKLSVNAFLIEALTHALGSRRVADSKEPR